jgi:hypothetical protein
MASMTAARPALAALLALAVAAGCVTPYPSGGSSQGSRSASSTRVRCADQPQRGAPGQAGGEAPESRPLVFLFCIQGP